jgi:hypothetical protein
MNRLPHDSDPDEHNPVPESADDGTPGVTSGSTNPTPDCEPMTPGEFAALRRQHKAESDAALARIHRATAAGVTGQPSVIAANPNKPKPPSKGSQPALTKAKPPWKPPNADPTPPSRRLITSSADKIDMQPTLWLVPDFIVVGGLNLIAGDGGFGKSSLTIHLAACLSMGEPCFGLNYATAGQMRTLLVSCEDSRSATIIPRLAAAGAALAYISFVDDIAVGDNDSIPFVLSPSGIEALEQAIVEAGDVAAVIIDPVSAFLPEGIDDHKDSHVRRMLRPLAQMAERTGVAIILIKHLSKSDSGNGGNLVAGSRAYVNASRAAFLVGPDPTEEAEEDSRVLVYAKRNLTKRRKGLVFKAVSLTEEEAELVLALKQAKKLTEPEREALREQLFRLEWLGETDATDMDLAKARCGDAPSGNRERRIEDCLSWLRSFLGYKIRLADDVMTEARKAGFSKKTVYAAKKKDKAIRASNRGISHGKWHWWVEQVEPPLPE